MRSPLAAAAVLSALLLAGVAAGAEDAPKLRFGAVLFALEPTRDRDARDAGLDWAFLGASYEKDGWGARAEVRATEGKFRPYYPGSFWLEEGYALVTTPVGEARLGKVGSSFGLADETFGGNLFSRNGITRNPEWGAALVGEKRFGWNSLGWNVRIVGQNDHVAWEDDGRGAESDPATTLRDGFEGRLSYLVDRGLVRLRTGLWGATARIVRSDGRPDFRRTDGAADVTGSFGPLFLSALVFYRDGDRREAGGIQPRLAYDDAWAGLLGVRLELPTVAFRYVYTEWRYRGLDANERAHQPSVVWTPKRWLEATIEYAARRIRLPDAVRTDNAFRFGLAFSF